MTQNLLTPCNLQERSLEGLSPQGVPDAILMIAEGLERNAFEGQLRKLPRTGFRVSSGQTLRQEVRQRRSFRD
jgi:hypothetical protein